MALQSSGAISLLDIAQEFGGGVPHALNEYYRNGGLVPDISPYNDNIPTSGTIAFDDFYGALNAAPFIVRMIGAGGGGASGVNDGTGSPQSSYAGGSGTSSVIASINIDNVSGIYYDNINGVFGNYSQLNSPGGTGGTHNAGTNGNAGAASVYGPGGPGGNANNSAPSPFTGTNFADDSVDSPRRVNNTSWNYIKVPAGYSGAELGHSSSDRIAVESTNGLGVGIHRSTANAEWIISGSGTVYYEVYVDSERYWDFSRFYLNGTRYVNISGQNTTSTGNLAASAGTVIKWQYYKDGSVDRYSDLGRCYFYVTNQSTLDYSYGAGGGGGGGDASSKNDPSGTGGNGGNAGTNQTGPVGTVPLLTNGQHWIYFKRSNPSLTSQYRPFVGFQGAGNNQGNQNGAAGANGRIQIVDMQNWEEWNWRGAGVNNYVWQVPEG